MNRESVFTEEDRKEAKNCFSRSGFGLALMIIITYGLTLLFSRLIRQTSITIPENSWIPWIIQYGALYLIALPLFLLILQPVPRTVPEGGRFSPKHLLVVFPVCIFVMYASNSITLFLNYLLSERFGLDVSQLVQEALENMGLLQRIVIPVIIAPVMEEFVFRRQLIDRMHVYGERLAVVTSAVLFGLFHGNLIQVLYATTLGIILGYVYLKSGRLRYSILLHMMINGISAIATTLISHADLDALEEMQSSMQNGADYTDPEVIEQMANVFSPALIALMMLVTVLLFLFLAGLVLLIAFRKKISFCPAELELPRGKRFSTVWLNIGMGLFILAVIGEFIMSYISVS